jgi:hypothetical protein
MRGVSFRSGLWLAGALLGLTLSGACEVTPQEPHGLNPQPLPPGMDDNGAPAASGSSSGSSFESDDGGLAVVAPGSGSEFSSGSSGSGSVSVGDDAGSIPVVELDASLPQDASAEDGGDAATVIDAGTDAGPAGDGGTNGATDASIVDASADGRCVHAPDCHVSHPGACARCAWPLDYAVCVEHQCGCACDERDCAGD